MSDGLDELGLPPLGHNQPPATEPSPEATAAVARTDELIATVDRWLQERPKIADAEQAGAAQLLIDQLRAAALDLDTARKDATKPLEDVLFLLRLFFKPSAERIDAGLKRMLGMMGDWLQRERHRLADERAAKAKAAEEAARKANEAIERAVTQPSVDADVEARRLTDAAVTADKAARAAPDRPQVKGDYAKRAMSLRSNWKARVTDPRLALKHYAKHPAIREAALAAIVKVAGAEAKAVKGTGVPPPGCEFYNDETPT